MLSFENDVMCSFAIIFPSTSLTFSVYGCSSTSLSKVLVSLFLAFFVLEYFLKYMIYFIISVFSLLNKSSFLSFQYHPLCVLPILSQQSRASFSPLWVVGCNSVKTKLDKIYWDEGIESFSFNFILVCDCVLFTLMFSITKELPEERGGFIYILLFSTKRNYWKIFYWGGWYSTMNATFIIHFFPFMKIIRRKFLCSSIMKYCLHSL